MSIPPNPEKLAFIKNQGIPVSTEKYTLETLYNLAVTKDIVRDFLCFGSNDPNDDQCKNCYVKDKCRDLTGYLDWLYKFKYSSDCIVVSFYDKKGKRNLVSTSISTLLSEVGYRENTKSYKIAELILKSNNIPYGELLNRIHEIIGLEKSPAYAKVRFYKIRKQLEDKTGMKIRTHTQKLLHLNKDVKEEKENA